MVWQICVVCLPGRASCKLKQFIMMYFYLYVITFIKQFCSFGGCGYKLVGFWGENTVNVPCFVAKKIKKWRISAVLRVFCACGVIILYPNRRVEMLFCMCFVWLFGVRNCL